MSISGRCVVPTAVLFGALALMVLTSCATGVSREELADEYVNIGNAWLELGEPEEAAEYLVRAVDLNPDLAAANFNLARAWLEVDRVGEAIDVLEELAERDPQNTVVLRTLGVAHYRAGNMTAAREAFEDALEENPRDADSLYNLGLIAAEEGNRDRSINLLEQARSIDDGADVVRAYGLALFEQRRYEEAGEQLEEVADEYAEDSRVLEARARIAEEREDYAEAVSLYETLLRQDDERPEARFRLARIRLVATEEREAGIADLRAAVEQGYDDTAAFEVLLADLEGETYELVEGLLLDEGLLPPREQSDDEPEENGEPEAQQ